MLRKKVLKSGDVQIPHPTWGQEVTVMMQGVLEDRTVVEKDCKLVFVIGEGDVNQVEIILISRSFSVCGVAYLSSCGFTQLLLLKYFGEL